MSMRRYSFQCLPFYFTLVPREKAFMTEPNWHVMGILFSVFDVGWKYSWGDPFTTAFPKKNRNSHKASLYHLNIKIDMIITQIVYFMYLLEGFK